MKTITSVALVLLMSLQCFYKLGVLTYFELNRDYIAEILCINKEEPITMCYGQCFLDKNLDLADKSAGDGAMPSGKQQIDFPVFLVSESSYRFDSIIKIVQAHGVYIPHASSKHTSAPFHPPAFVS